MIDILILALRFPIATLFSSSWVMDKYSFKILSIAISLYSIPNFWAISTPWILSSVGVVVDGIIIPNTLSLPKASHAKCATSVESIPPLKPIIIPLLFDSSSFVWIKLIISFLDFSKSNSGMLLIVSPPI